MGFKRQKAAMAEGAKQNQEWMAQQHDYCKVRKSKNPNYKPKPAQDPYEAKVRIALKYMQGCSQATAKKSGRTKPSIPKIAFQDRKKIGTETV